MISAAEATDLQHLWRAVLTRAVLDFRGVVAGTDRPPELVIEEAREWLFDHDGREPGSFFWVCDVCDVDPGRVRRGLLEDDGAWVRRRRLDA